MCERLKEARDSNTNMEEGYNEEIRAQTNLANLYKAKAIEDKDYFEGSLSGLEQEGESSRKRNSYSILIKRNFFQYIFEEIGFNEVFTSFVFDHTYLSHKRGRKQKHNGSRKTSK